jgi:hypothetical protein
MLDRLKPLLGYRILASDGHIGTLDNLYFDDSLWITRYLIVDTGTFLHRHSVLISPMAIVGIDWDGKAISLEYSKAQVANSPDIDVDKPVYRQIEEQLSNYYGWVSHWTPQRDLPEPQSEPVLTGDTHLRSMRNVCTYTVMASDGTVGVVDDLVVDLNGWSIPLAILDTRHYLPATQVVIPAQRLKGIRVPDREISINMNKSDVSASPHFDPALQLDGYLTGLARESEPLPAAGGTPRKG